MSMLSHAERQVVRTALAGVAGLVLACSCGCLNPTFVSQLSGGSTVPLAPGDTPFVHVLVINATEELIVDVQFGFTPEFQGFNSALVGGILPGQQSGFLLACPVSQIGLGDPTDLGAPAVTLTTAEDVEINVPPAAFPLVVRNGTDFSCGDTVVFTIVDDRSNGYGISVQPGRVNGANHTGPFSGPDTFEIVNLLLMSSGVPPTVVP